MAEQPTMTTLMFAAHALHYAIKHLPSDDTDPYVVGLEVAEKLLYDEMLRRQPDPTHKQVDKLHDKARKLARKIRKNDGAATGNLEKWLYGEELDD